jgi:hypothetical protein
MVQTALNDEDVAGSVLERQMTAIADENFAGATIFREQTLGEVYALDMREAQAAERMESAAAAAK